MKEQQHYTVLYRQQNYGHNKTWLALHSLSAEQQQGHGPYPTTHCPHSSQVGPRNLQASSDAHQDF
jgi:hypothetical protein